MPEERSGGLARRVSANNSDETNEPMAVWAYIEIADVLIADDAVGERSRGSNANVETDCGASL